jgi:glycine cleavage system H protein
MPSEPPATIYYKRARFTTRLPVDRLYAPSHYWVKEESPGTYRIGLTRFATRMLGDFVELQFHVAAGEPVELGQPIGSIEGFKAVSDIYGVMAGRFAAANPALDSDPTLLERQHYEAGWLYRMIEGRPEGLLDVHGYIGLLDATIDRMLEEQQVNKEQSC